MGFQVLYSVLLSSISVLILQKSFLLTLLCVSFFFVFFSLFLLLSKFFSMNKVDYYCIYHFVGV